MTKNNYIFYHRNCHPANKVVTFWSLCFYSSFVIVSIAYFSNCTINDYPYSILVETCSRAQPRALSPGSILALILPNLFNVASLCTDILLIRFLHKTVLPTIATKRENSISNRPEPDLSTFNRQVHFSRGYLKPNTRSLNSAEPEGKLTNTSGVHKSDLITSNAELPTGNGWYEKLNCWNPMSKIQGPERIPIRVSLMSSMLVFPFFAIQMACTAFNASFEQRTYISWLGLAVSNTLRGPLTVMLAFKAKTKPIILK